MSGMIATSPGARKTISAESFMKAGLSFRSETYRGVGGRRGAIKRALVTNTRLIGIAAAAITARSASAQSAKWAIDPIPLVTLGTTGDGSTAEFAFVTGATLLPDRNFMVGDRSDYSMFIVSPAGKVLKKFARNGSGPGELKGAFFSWRCGQQVFVKENTGATSVFALDGTFIRKFQFSSAISKQGTYRSACNQNGMFVHYGWYSDKDRTPGVPYRSRVPAWISKGDSSAGRLIATVKSSERWEYTLQPLGRETMVAVGRDRVYVGEADNYEVKVFTLDGTPLQSITKTVKPVAVTKQDIDDEVDRMMAMMGAQFRKGVEKEYATIPMPKTLPPYRELQVDSAQNLWVRDYARSGPLNVIWTVFDPRGKQITEIALPNALEVFEIGIDYILGRYIDPNTGVPEVRLYRLVRK